MKTTVKITAIVAGLFITANVNAQTLNANAGISFSKFNLEGMETGSSTENYNGTTYTSNLTDKGVTGVTFGLSYEFNLGNRLSLEAGARFMSRGIEQTFTSEYRAPQFISNNIERTTFKMNYVDVPLMLNTAITTGKLRTYVRTGIYVGFLTNTKYSYYDECSNSDGVSSIYYSTETEMEHDPVERFTGGIQVGLGASYKQFYFETNYSLGEFMLSDFDSGVTSRDLSFTLGYKINFKKK